MPSATAPETVSPAHLWIPPRIGSHGDEAIDLAALAGRKLDPEQQIGVDALLSYGPGGRWVAFEGAVIEPRQNGKTGGILLPVTLYDLFLLPPDRIVWTAHLFRTAQDAFTDFVTCIETASFLSKRVKKISISHGEEYIELTSGAKLEFLARSGGGGRGLGGKRVVMDEALFLTADGMATLTPTLAARSITGDPQINYGSSAGLVRSDHLRALRDRGRPGGDPSLVWVEWKATGSWDEPGCGAGPECMHTRDTPGCSLDNEELWRQANPALGRRISYRYVRNERRALSPEGFGRERLGWFTDPPTGSGMALEKWDDCADGESVPTGRPVFAIDVSPESKSAAIVAAMLRPDGLPHIEIVAYAAGIDWVVGRAGELKKHLPLDWIVDPAGPAGALLPDLAAVGVTPRQMTSRDLGQACEAFAAAVDAKALRHLGDPVLLRALTAAGRRSIGDGLWAWSRTKSDGDICQLVGATEAYWGLSVAPPPEPPPAEPVTAPAGAGWETSELDRAGF